MAGNLATHVEPAPLVACTISRNVQEFDLLIEDMEAELGEGWGDLTFDEAEPFLNQPEAVDLEFVAVAIDKKDEPFLRKVGATIRVAKAAGLKVILIADNVGPLALQELMRDGADDFVSYPLVEGALAEAIERLDAPEPAPSRQRPARDTGSEETAASFVEDLRSPVAKTSTGGGGRSAGDAAVIAVHGLGGGVGATTLATNLAWEMAIMDSHPRVCLIDLDLQFGSVATYLDLKRRPLIFEILSDCQSMDQQAFKQGLLKYEHKLDVFTAPADILPLDLIGPDDVSALIRLARAEHDLVVIDMPAAVVSWTETVLQEADAYLALMEMDLRSAQNALRLMSAMEAEKLASHKVSYVMNRGPRDISGKGRIKRMADSIGVDFRFVLPDGGPAVSESNDNGEPLSDSQPKLPYRKEVMDMAERIWAAAQADEFTLDAISKPKSRSFFSFGK